MSDDSSSDAFDSSPIPTKKRRLNSRKRVPSSDSEGDESDGDLETPSPSWPRPRRAQPASKNAKSETEGLQNTTGAAKTHLKLKDRIHESRSGQQQLEDMYATQLPTVDSSPYRIRGAIWHKSAKPASPIRWKETEKDDTIVDDVHSDQEKLHQPARSGAASQKSSPLMRRKDVGQYEDEILVEDVKACAEDYGDLDFEISDLDRPGQTDPVPPTNASGVRSKNSHRTEPMELLDHEAGNDTDEFDIDEDLAQELADLPSDAFDSPISSPRHAHATDQAHHVMISSSTSRSAARPVQLVGPQNGLRQTTIFGSDATNQNNCQANDGKKYNWPLANRNEKPTHHKLNEQALRSWIYPTNIGSPRDYQYNIVARGLFHNLLVALPTGLGKTFIAATVMLNWFRWTVDSQIVFVAPTKPLVAQQVEACLGIAGIPRSSTSMLTGGIAPGLRAEEWASKRVFFMTPQTIVNDLKTGICDPKRLVLLVVDEAHRATGSYAYVEVVKFIRRFNQSFRILALTATPGSSVESVQEVVDGLDIARVEIRTEFSLDIRQYVHSRNVETILFDNSEEMTMIMDWFSKALQPVVNKLSQFNAYWSKDPMQLTAYGLTQARQRWMASPAGRSADFAIKGMLNRIFTVLASLAHSIELLKFHGIGPFYRGMLNFRSNQDGSRGGKYEKEILENANFTRMMTRLQFWMNNETFVGHPKLEYLQEIVLNHFLDAGEGRTAAVGEQPPLNTRVMIFAHYRDSAEEIVRVLRRNQPMVRPHVFVGQASAKGSEGMDQKKQLEIIQKFKEGVFNTIVATSIGEEGLDIGEIDRIVCYDSSASPIRMLQRMGRTGRKRAGNITLLLMKGKEERSFLQAKDNYEKMQQMIADGTRFNFHDAANAKILPVNAQPVAEKRLIEIPQENKEATLPEPKKRGRVPKRPPKKFHMPDGVQTGFVTAARMAGQEDGKPEAPKAASKRKTPQSRRAAKPNLAETEEVPRLDEVLLSSAQKLQLRRQYQDVVDRPGSGLIIEDPRLDTYPQHQRTVRPDCLVKHGSATRRVIKMLSSMSGQPEAHLRKLEKKAGVFANLDLDEACRVVSDDEEPLQKSAKTPAKRQKQALSVVQDDEHLSRTSKGKPERQSKRDLTDFDQNIFKDDSVEDGLSSSPPALSPRFFLPSQGISLGSDTSGEDEEDDVLLDSTLRDFIDDENEELLDPSTPSHESSSPMVLDSKVQPVNLFESSQGSRNSVLNSSFSNLPAQRLRLDEDVEISKENVYTIDDANDDDGHGNLVTKRKRRHIVHDSSD